MEVYTEFIVNRTFDDGSEISTRVRHEPGYRGLALAESIETICRPYELLASAIDVIADLKGYDDADSNYPDVGPLLRAAADYIEKWAERDEHFAVKVAAREKK
jgi:hypothetical protein